MLLSYRAEMDLEQCQQPRAGSQGGSFTEANAKAIQICRFPGFEQYFPACIYDRDAHAAARIVDLAACIGACPVSHNVRVLRTLYAIIRRRFHYEVAYLAHLEVENKSLQRSAPKSGTLSSQSNRPACSPKLHCTSWGYRRAQIFQVDQ